eukprot:401423-Prymnesium_polylepis.1
MALCKAAVRRVGGEEMEGSHHGQAASSEGVSVGAEGQERACDTMGGRDVEPGRVKRRRGQQRRRKGEGGEAQRGSAR